MAKKKEELNLEETKVEKKKSTNTKKVDTQIKKIKEEKVSIHTEANTKKTTKNVNASKSVAKPVNKAKEKVVDTKNTSSKAKNNVKKATNTKTTSSKKINSSNKKENNEVTPITEKGKVKEETIIEKIKSFIAKIVAMQEETNNEELAKKEKKKNTKKTATTDIDKLLKEPVYLTEYYDLPYRYNETVVKILAQTPKRIFVYWDVADEDRIRYEKAFGKDFFDKTYPVLLVHNDDKNYTTEIPINDFANSWYININDPKTKYTIQLGRKFKEIPTSIDIEKMQEQNIILHTDYLPIAQSNVLEVPNDRILFDKMPSKLIFRNVKTYEQKEKNVAEIKTPFGISFDVREFYSENYKNEIDEEILDLNNPTSGALSSSTFK